MIVWVTINKYEHIVNEVMYKSVIFKSKALLTVKSFAVLFVYPETFNIKE